jgi:hypothetical protein
VAARIFFGFRFFERVQDFVSDRHGVSETLQPRRIFFELVAPKVAVSCPCRQNQVIVGKRDSLTVSVIDEHAPLILVHADDFTQDHSCIFLVSKDSANWSTYLARGQNRCRHLIEQRLEYVVVGAVDQNDLRWSIPQCSTGRQPAKPSTDDDDVQSRHVFLSSAHTFEGLAEAVGSSNISRFTKCTGRLAWTGLAIGIAEAFLRMVFARIRDRPSPLRRLPPSEMESISWSRRVHRDVRERKSLVAVTHSVVSAPMPICWQLSRC